MRLLFSLTSFAFTMILALIAFTYTAINFPTTMRDLLGGAKHMQESLSSLGWLSDSYMVWVDIFLQPNQIVLICFSIAMRFAISLIGWLLSAGSSSGHGGKGSREVAVSTAPGERYRRWGRGLRQ